MNRFHRREFWLQFRLVSIGCFIAAIIGFVATNGQVIVGKPIDWGSVWVLVMAIVFAWILLSVIALVREYAESRKTR